MAKRAALNIYLTDKLSDRISKHRDINWSAVCRAAIEAKLSELALEELALGPRKIHRARPKERIKGSGSLEPDKAAGAPALPQEMASQWPTLPYSWPRPGEFGYTPRHADLDRLLHELRYGEKKDD